MSGAPVALLLIALFVAIALPACPPPSASRQAGTHAQATTSHVRTAGSHAGTASCGIETVDEFGLPRPQTRPAICVQNSDGEHIVPACEAPDDCAPPRELWTETEPRAPGHDGRTILMLLTVLRN